MYEAFQSGDVDEFAFFLAAKLGMTVEHMDEIMSHREYVQWSVYFGREAQRRQLRKR
jgi:hypothetical protein